MIKGDKHVFHINPKSSPSSCPDGVFLLPTKGLKRKWCGIELCVPANAARHVFVPRKDI